MTHTQWFVFVTLALGGNGMSRPGSYTLGLGPIGASRIYVLFIAFLAQALEAEQFGENFCSAAVLMETPPEFVCFECHEPFYVWRFAPGQAPGTRGERVQHEKGRRRDLWVSPYTHIICVHQGCVRGVIAKGLSPICTEWYCPFPSRSIR